MPELIKCILNAKKKKASTKCLNGMKLIILYVIVIIRISEYSHYLQIFLSHYQIKHL